LREFFTTFASTSPAAAPSSAVEDITRREAARAAELAGDGTLARLWALPAENGQTRALGLWRAADEQAMQAVLDSLPMSTSTSTSTSMSMSNRMTVETIALSVHPGDPAAVSRADGTQE
jgi:muconolactone delta-isomerase